MKKAVMLINDTTYAFNLRGAIIEKLIKTGFEVVIVGQLLKYQDELKAMGAKLIGVATGRHGTNPLKDLKLMWKYRKILENEQPDIALTYNIKPNVYGGIICQILKIPYLVNVTGLGTPVENPGKLQNLAMILYKVGVAGSACIFFQNEENRAFFERHNMLKKGAKTRLIPGSGVDLAKHTLRPWHECKRIHFLFAARIMKDKGIDLFIAAARKFADKNIIFDVCGACDDENYKSILLHEEKIIYHGEQKDLTPFYNECTCFLFPSYYPEGMSNVLLEAAACGRPVIATNRAGCRETVDDGVSGYIVPIKNEAAVLKAVEKFLALRDDERKQMGLAGRFKMEREFDRKFVVQAYMEEIGKII